MTNTEMLKAAGWITLDGYLCNPELHYEPVFEVDRVDDIPLYRLFATITLTAVNYGFREAKEEYKPKLFSLKEFTKNSKS